MIETKLVLSARVACEHDMPRRFATDVYVIFLKYSVSMRLSALVTRLVIWECE